MAWQASASSKRLSTKRLSLLHSVVALSRFLSSTGYRLSCPPPERERMMRGEGGPREMKRETMKREEDNEERENKEDHVAARWGREE